MKEKWKTFINNLTNKNILNLIVDCNIVASSKDVAILTNIIDGTSNLINNNLHTIESLFNEKYNTNYKFIALTESMWKKEKEEYIENLKNKKEYHYIKEPELEKNEENLKEDIDNIEKIAYDIFDKEKIEIE